MTLVRDDRQVALNEVVVCAREAADNHRDAASRVEDEELRRLLEAHAGRHELLAEQIAEQLKRLDDLPKEPDRDAETLHQLFSRIKAAFSGDEEQALADDRVAEDAKVATAIDEALRHDLPQKTRAQLQEFRELLQAEMAELRQRTH